MYSMTGYGKGEYHEGGIQLTVELKTVNNRYLDLNVKSPRIFNAYEDLIRNALRDKIVRGHVDVFVSYSDKRERAKNFYVDLATASAYKNAAQEIKEKFPDLRDDINVSFFLKLPDVVKAEEQEGADEEMVKALSCALEKAVEALVQMRLSEGERLKADLTARMQTIQALRDKIALRAPLVAEEYRKKLTERMQELLSGKVDETRILTEAALFSDKCNIDEELTRLSSHVTQFYCILNEERAGRKLDFLVQEFNRECNTICSKSNDSEVTAHALAMKNEIEKIREQIQNLE